MATSFRDGNVANDDKPIVSQVLEVMRGRDIEVGRQSVHDQNVGAFGIGIMLPGNDVPVMEKNAGRRRVVPEDLADQDPSHVVRPADGGGCRRITRGHLASSLHDRRSPPGMNMW